MLDRDDCSEEHESNSTNWLLLLMAGLTCAFLLGVAIWALTKSKKTTSLENAKRGATPIKSQMPNLTTLTTSDSENPKSQASPRGSSTRKWYSSPKAIVATVIAVVLFPVGIYYCFFHRGNSSSRDTPVTSSIADTVFSWPVAVGGTIAGYLWYNHKTTSSQDQTHPHSQTLSGQSNNGGSSPQAPSDPKPQPSAGNRNGYKSNAARLAQGQRKHAQAKPWLNIKKIPVPPVTQQATPSELQTMKAMADRVKQFIKNAGSSGGSLTRWRAIKHGQLVTDSSKYDWDKVLSGDKRFRVSSNSGAQQHFYQALLNDPDHMDRFKLGCEIVSLGWGWDINQKSSTKFSRKVYAMRWYKMCKCLALMEQYKQDSQHPWISKYYDSLIELSSKHDMDSSVQLDPMIKNFAAEETNNLQTRFRGDYGRTWK